MESSAEIWKGAGAVLGLVLGVPALILVWRVAMFVGRATATLESLGESMKELAATLGDFTSETRAQLSAHGEQLAVHDAAIEGLERRERDRQRVGAYDRRS